MFDQLIDSMGPGILRTLLQLLNPFTKVCVRIVEYSGSTIRDILTGYLETTTAPEWLVNVIDFILGTDAAWIYNITIGEIILGSFLIIVVCFGIVKFFTDIVL